MKGNILYITCMILFFCLIGTVMAISPQSPLEQPPGQPVEVYLSPTPDGSYCDWGKLTYYVEGDNEDTFVFEGKGLIIRTEYALVLNYDLIEVCMDSGIARESDTGIGVLTLKHSMPDINPEGEDSVAVFTLREGTCDDYPNTAVLEGSINVVEGKLL